MLSTLGGLISTALFFVVGRYRIPWVPGLALLAAAGVVDTSRRLTARRWQELALSIGLLAAPVALTVECTACGAPVQAEHDPVAAIRPGLNLISEQPQS